MKDIAVLVYHVKVKFAAVCGNQRKAGLRTAEHRTVHRLHIPAERRGRVHDIVDIAAVLADMLERMDMPADVHVHIVMPEQNRIYPVLHVLPL